MELSSLFLSNMTVNTDAAMAKTQLFSDNSKGPSFDSALSSARQGTTERSQNPKRPDVSEERRVSSSGRQRSNVNQSKEAQTRVASEDAEPDSTNTNGRTTEIKNSTKNEKVGEAKKQATDSTVQDEEKVGEIADALNVPAELVQSILDQLNIKPMDLMDKSNMVKFMQVLNEVQTPLELLSVPNLKEMYEAVEDVLTEAAGELSSEQDTELHTENIKMLHTDDTATESDTRNMSEEGSHKNNGESQKGNLSADIKSDSSVNSGVATQDTEQVQAGTQPVEPILEGQMKVADDFVVSAQPVMTQVTDIDGEAQPQAPVIQDSSSSGFAHASDKAAASQSGSRAELFRDVFNQINQRIKIAVDPETSELKMILKPESLGSLTLKLSTENGALTAHFVAENQRVKEIIESNFNQLRDSLAEQGISVNNLSVSVEQNNDDQQMQQFMESQNKSKRRISQILSNIEAEESAAAGEINYITRQDVEQSQIDYIA